jgi:K+-transporting ATPase A subunit
MFWSGYVHLFFCTKSFDSKFQVVLPSLQGSSHKPQPKSNPDGFDGLQQNECVLNVNNSTRKDAIKENLIARITTRVIVLVIIFCVWLKKPLDRSLVRLTSPLHLYQGIIIIIIIIIIITTSLPTR